MVFQQSHPKKIDLNFKCHVHLDVGCEGHLETRRSVLGASQTACWKAWHEPIVILEHSVTGDKKQVTVDLSLWPTVVN